MFARKLIKAVVLASASALSVSAVAQNISAVRGGNALVTVRSNAPSAIVRTVAVSGLGAGQPEYGG